MTLAWQLLKSTKNYFQTQRITEKWWESYYSKIKGVDIPSSIDRVSLECVYPFQSSSHFNFTRLGDDIYITGVESMTAINRSYFRLQVCVETGHTGHIYMPKIRV